MVQHPSEYRWSSYRANAEGAYSSLLSPQGEYLRLGSDGVERQEAYKALFNAHVDPKRVEEIQTATNSNYALGNDRFREQIEQTLKRRAARGTNGRPRKSGVAS